MLSRQRGVIDYLCLSLAKPGLALDLEYHGDPHAGPGFDLPVAVVEGLAEAAGELPADGRLARAHHADEEDIAVRYSRGLL